MLLFDVGIVWISILSGLDNVLSRSVSSYSTNKIRHVCQRSVTEVRLWLTAPLNNSQVPESVAFSQRENFRNIFLWSSKHFFQTQFCLAKSTIKVRCDSGVFLNGLGL